jgi:hypothetical protein
MDDITIDRLSKPVDHSTLKRRIEREQKQEFEMSRPILMRRSRSRSARKPTKDFNKSLNKKYKTFVSKFGKGDSEEEDGDQWRGANDFTRITIEDDKRGIQEHAKRR